MTDGEWEVLRERIQRFAAAEEIRITQHAQQEMVEEGISLAEVFETIRDATILENFPEHRRGSCCLICGQTGAGRPLHAVCTTAQRVLILITVYEAKPPKWKSPTERRQ